MKTPTTSAPLYLFMDPAARYRILASASGNTTTALQVGSLTDRISGHSIVAGSSAAPIWSGSSFYGKYAAGAGTTSICAPLAGQQAGVTFNGSTQCLEYDTLASQLPTGSDPPLTMVVEIACSAPNSGTNQTLFSFGASGSGTPLLECYINGGSLVFTETNTGGTSTATYASFGTTNTAAHVVTAVRTGTALTLRVDGVQVATAALTAASGTFNFFCIGARHSNASTINYFTGVIAHLLAFGSNTGGIADIVDLEKELMLAAGITEF